MPSGGMIVRVLVNMYDVIAIQQCDGLIHSISSIVTVAHCSAFSMPHYNVSVLISLEKSYLVLTRALTPPRCICINYICTSTKTKFDWATRVA